MIWKILAAIKGGNHVALYGERRIGKTSLLHRLEYLLQQDSEAVFALLFIQMQLLPEDKFFGFLSDSLLKSTPDSVKETLPPLLRSASSQVYDVLDLSEDLETIIGSWNKTTGKPVRLVLLLDEGDRLNEFSETSQMELRGLLQNPFVNQHVRLVWSGVGIDRDWHSDTSPWFNLFKAEFQLDPLKPEEARRLILEPVGGVYRYQKEAIAKILDMTGHKPYLIQRLCSHSIDQIQARGTKEGRITLEDIEAAWAKIEQEDRAARAVVYEPAPPQTQLAESPAEYEPGV